MTTRVRCWHAGWARRLPDYDPAAGPALVLRPRPDTALAWPTHMGCRGRCCSCGRSEPYFSHSVRQAVTCWQPRVRASLGLRVPAGSDPCPGRAAAAGARGSSSRHGCLVDRRALATTWSTGRRPGRRVAACQRFLAGPLPVRARGARAAGASVRRVAARIGLGWSGLRVSPAGGPRTPAWQPLGLSSRPGG